MKAAKHIIKQLIAILSFFIVLLGTTACADEIAVGDKISLFPNTYLWDGAGIDAEKIAILMEPMDAEVTGESEENRFPVKVGVIEGYIDKAILDRALNGKSIYSEEDQEQLRADIVSYAVRYTGNPYLWGGTSLTDGADCSGFVQTVFADHGIYLPRTSQEQGVFGTRKSVEDAEKGDLILYSDGSEAYHVALYIGDGKTVQAMSAKEGIVIADVGNASWAVDVIS